MLSIFVNSRKGKEIIMYWNGTRCSPIAGFGLR